LAGVFAAILFSAPLYSYSVLTHEAIIDTAWNDDIRPLLVKRFPASTPEQLREAHGYAYAGAIIQDMGYYPLGSQFFSDLAHYVRSGTFIVNLIRESQTLNDYAFALGALAHYAADTQGHAVAVNPSVALQYPKLARKFGNTVTYADNTTSHLRVELAFDVLQVARGNYAPQAYHDFIGFEVSRGVLDRAFHDTYSLEMSDVFSDEEQSLGTYRRMVSGFIPAVTRAAWRVKKHDLLQADPSMTRKRFVYNLSRASYRKNWSGKYKEPGFRTRFLAFLIRVLPKVGPLRALDFKPPTHETEALFQTSFDRTMDEYRKLLRDAGAGTLSLPDRDFDTGKPTRPGEYRLADDAYSKLARKLAERDPATIDPAVRANVLSYYHDLSQPYATKRKQKDWDKTVTAIGKLRASN
jgi:hypothetical protein